MKRSVIPYRRYCYAMLLKYSGPVLIAGSLCSCGSNSSDKIADEAKSTPRDSVVLAMEENRDKDSDSTVNATFIKDAVINDHNGIALAKAAKKRSNNTNIRRIALNLEKEHSESLNRLKTYAALHAIDISGEETADVNEKIKQMGSGSQFDSTWCAYLIDVQKQLIDKYQSFDNRTKDEGVKKWLSETLPETRMHLSMLQEEITYLHK